MADVMGWPRGFRLDAIMYAEIGDTTKTTPCTEASESLSCVRLTTYDAVVYEGLISLIYHGGSNSNVTTASK